jgi:hypothetical protein
MICLEIFFSNMDNYSQITVTCIKSYLFNDYFEIILKNGSNKIKITIRTYRDCFVLDSSFWEWIQNFDTLYLFPEYQKYRVLDTIFSLKDPLFSEETPKFYLEELVINLPKFSSPSHMLFFYKNPNKILRSMFKYKYNLSKHEPNVWNKILINRTLFALLSPLL